MIGRTRLTLTPYRPNTNRSCRRRSASHCISSLDSGLWSVRASTGSSRYRASLYPHCADFWKAPTPVSTTSARGKIGYEPARLIRLDADLAIAAARLAPRHTLPTADSIICRYSGLLTWLLVSITASGTANEWTKTPGLGQSWVAVPDDGKRQRPVRQMVPGRLDRQRGLRPYRMPRESTGCQQSAMRRHSLLGCSCPLHAGSGRWLILASPPPSDPKEPWDGLTAMAAT